MNAKDAKSAKCWEKWIEGCGVRGRLGPGQGDSGRFRLVVWERAGIGRWPGAEIFGFCEIVNLGRHLMV